MDKLQVLSECSIEDNIVKLPAIQLERKLYEEVAKAINLIGGKWKGGKISGFVFNEDPTDLLKQIQSGVKKDIKKEYQFFATPARLAAKMVRLAEIDQYDCICEPSAGQGAIIKEIHNAHPNTLVHYCELMELNRNFLIKLSNTTYLKDNFLLMNTPTLFHKIIANPPFSQNQDIQHIMHMWKCLAPGGRIVTISSKHWEYSNNKKEQAFKAFLEDNNAIIQSLPPETFKDSGTNVSANLLIIDKSLT